MKNLKDTIGKLSDVMLTEFESMRDEYQNEI